LIAFQELPFDGRDGEQYCLPPAMAPRRVRSSGFASSTAPLASGALALV
jgi:hypothetical protein